MHIWKAAHTNSAWSSQLLKPVFCTHLEFYLNPEIWPTRAHLPILPTKCPHQSNRLSWVVWSAEFIEWKRKSCHDVTRTAIPSGVASEWTVRSHVINNSLGILLEPSAAERLSVVLTWSKSQVSLFLKSEPSRASDKGTNRPKLKQAVQLSYRTPENCAADRGN